MDPVLVKKITELERRLDRLALPERGTKVDSTNVSSPPSDAELDAAFPNAYNGFTAIVDDAGAGATVWFVAMANDSWWYEQLTAAV